MVTHRRRRTILTVLGLYIFAALFIGYFAANAFTGNHGLRAQQDLEQQLAVMRSELTELKAERAHWERRVSLLRTDRIDPDSRYPRVALKFLAKFKPFCAILGDSPTLSPPQNLSYWDLGKPTDALSQ
jgi:cell division protein FtsB